MFEQFHPKNMQEHTTDCLHGVQLCVAHLHMTTVPVPFPAAAFAADLHLSSRCVLQLPFFSSQCISTALSLLLYPPIKDTGDTLTSQPCVIVKTPFSTWFWSFLNEFSGLLRSWECLLCSLPISTLTYECIGGGVGGGLLGNQINVYRQCSGVWTRQKDWF